MDVSAYFDRVSEMNPDFSDTITELQTLYNKKLWYQLTLKIQQNLKDVKFTSTIELIPFFKTVILSFASNMSQFSFAQIAGDISKTIMDLEEKKTFLLSLIDLPHVVEEKEAFILLGSLIAELEANSGSFEESKSRLEDLKNKIESLNIVDSTVYAAYYRACAVLNNLKSDTQKFYINGLKYLSYAIIDQVDPIEKTQLAFDLCLSALKGPDIYNFGELIENKILQSIKGTENEWIECVIRAFSEGNINEWETISQTYQSQLQRHLNGYEALLNQKISIMSVIELIFNEYSVSRNISFEKISSSGRIRMEEVEILLMRALSLGLLKGKIDQILKVFTVSWVQPRVLSTSQILGMAKKLEDWKTTVQNTLGLVEGQVTPELIS